MGHNEGSSNLTVVANVLDIFYIIIYSKVRNFKFYTFDDSLFIILCIVSDKQII